MTIDLRRDLAHALDPVAFAQDRLGFTPDDWQCRLLRSESSKQIVNCSRQSGKSTTCAAKALHRALYDPGSLTLLIAPAQRQSRELFQKIMDFMSRLTPAQTLDEDNRLSATLTNGSRVVSCPGDARTLRGFSAPSLIVLDEAAQVDDGLLVAVRPMLAVSAGQLVLLSTPYGRRGSFWEIWENGDDTWERVRVTADQCPRISAEFLASERAEIGETLYQQEYMCEFIDSNTSAFSSALIEMALTDDFAPFL